MGDTTLRRYRGEELNPASRIAVVANDAIGNFVVGTPLLQMLRDRWQPSVLDYYGGSRTWELIEASDLVDVGYPLHGAPPHRTAETIAERVADGAYDLVVNMEWSAYAKVCTGMMASGETYVCGPSIGLGGRADLPFADDERGALWRDQEWIDAGLTSRYPFLTTGFIGEIFCRLAYLEGEVPTYRLPRKTVGEPIPDVLIATAASLPEKLWTFDAWKASLDWLKSKGLTVGLIGAPPAAQKQFWQGDSLEDDLIQATELIDLRGRFTLPQVVDALDRAKAVLTIDNGVLHLAAATSTPTVGLFRHGIHRLWAPPKSNLDVLTPEPDALVATIPVTKVLEHLEQRLSSSS